MHPRLQQLLHGDVSHTASSWLVRRSAAGKATWPDSNPAGTSFALAGRVNFLQIMFLYQKFQGFTRFLGEVYGRCG